MKNTFKSILLIAAATFTLASCNNLLDTDSPSTQEASVVYSNYTYAEQAIYSIHQTFCNQNSFPGTASTPTSNGSWTVRPTTSRQR